jgi:hypothetical protein
VGPRGRAFAHCVMRDTEGRAAIPLARVVLPQIRAQLAATGTSTASTAGVLEAPLDCARARLATQGMKERAVRQPALALPWQILPRTVATALSTASTAGLLVGLLDHAHAHAKQDTKVRAVRLRALAPPLQTRLRMALAGASTASTAALLAA